MKFINFKYIRYFFLYNEIYKFFLYNEIFRNIRYFLIQNFPIIFRKNKKNKCG